MEQITPTWGYSAASWHADGTEIHEVRSFLILLENDFA
jgi:hypothetical protein